jgi:hypothetical protein
MHAMTERSAGEVDVVDLLGMARGNAAFSPIWTHQSDDLNVNLLVFERGDGVAEHVNAEVDVLLVGVAGQGEIDRRRCGPVWPPSFRKGRAGRSARPATASSI